MSVDSTELERAALQQKDREQLVTIATAMGQKPPSRARKSEIVDLILELAGVGGGDDGSNTDANRGEDTKADDGGSDADADGDDDGDDEADTTDDDALDSSAAQSADGDDDDADADDVPSASSGRDGSGDGADGSSRGSDERSSGRSRSRNSRNRNGSSSRDGGDTSGRDGASRENGRDRSGDGDSSSEQDSGNRRRRRRGRDRNRGEDTFTGDPTPVEGVVDLRDEGYAFLRVNGHLPSREDVYIPVKQVRNLGLRKGDQLSGSSRPAGRNEKNPALHAVDAVNGGDPEQLTDRPRFDDLTPVFPDEQLVLEGSGDADTVTARIIDLLAPIGKGQRGLIVSPPKAGRTTILKQVATAIESNHPDVELIVLLVDERPEEVTDMERSLERATVAASAFDRPAEEHIQVADLTIEIAKRRVEAGSDVVLLFDGLTRLARAHNLAAPGNGRTMAGGLDSSAIHPPKKLFGSARNVEEGGSLTILATALVESGSAMDEVIFDELSGTANMELRLDASLAAKRTFPAIDVAGSSTRQEDQLLDAAKLDQAASLRRDASDAADDRTGLDIVLERLA